MITFSRMKMCEVQQYIEWSQEPPIKKWYFNYEDEKNIKQKITSPIVNGNSVYSYTVRLDNSPIGYAQWYWCKNEPCHWGRSYNDAIGIDVFLSQESIHKKIGREVIKKFCSYIAKSNRTRKIVADPKKENIASLKAFSYAGFRIVQNNQSNIIFEVLMQ